MRILAGGSWKDGYLDYHLSDREVRVDVRVYLPLLHLPDVYLAQSRSLRRLWNYLWEVGPISLSRKVRSRLDERERNEKFLGVGLGVVREVGAKVTDAPSPGSTVVFAAPCHPRCFERVVLIPELLRAVEEESWASLGSPNAVLYSEIRLGAGTVPAVERVAGYQPYSGSPLDPADLEACLALAEEQLRSVPARDWRTLVGSGDETSETSRSAIQPTQGALSATVFGYGHYAKTNVLPNLAEGIRCTSVHEIDPTQIGAVDDMPFRCDTSPEPRRGERHDIVCIAGYHHTHAPLAAQALRSGSWAIVEKPLATTHEQLSELLDAARAHPGRLFAGFHKRYSQLNDYTREDLAVAPGDPVSYYCVVFEVPLPARHWYFWPNSRSRLTSNGCHWIDHFLYLNDFAEVIDYAVHEFPNEDLACWAELANGANFNMVLTDKGSSRIGLQEYVEMRTGDRTVSVKNNSVYRAESSSRNLRRARVNKQAGYRNMYRTISEKIVRGEPGDSYESLDRSTRLMLDLERALADGRGRRE